MRYENQALRLWSKHSGTRLACHLIAPAVPARVLQTMINPWRLLSLALEAKPDRGIL